MKSTIAASIRYLSSKWQLSNFTQLGESTFTNNYVAKAHSAHYNRQVVLKLCVVDTHEREALQYFNGNGCVALLDYDPYHRALLLEYIQPGTLLKSLFPAQDQKTVVIMAEIVKKLHTHPATTEDMRPFKTVEQWLRKLDTHVSTIIPAQLLEKARILAAELAHTQGPLYVLHGDLHHENILKNDDTWIAIDPKGVIGELAYEFGHFYA